jgi:hypothetical protein
LPVGLSEIFLLTGLDRQVDDLPVGQISRPAQRSGRGVTSALAD